VLGIREDLSKTRGATVESINALPTYKCKLSKNEGADDEQICLCTCKSGPVGDETKDRTISQEDAVSLPVGDVVLGSWLMISFSEG